MGMPSCACIPPDGDDWDEPWLRECDHHRAQRQNLDIARGALADIAYSDDMYLMLARKKAHRIYSETGPIDHEGD